MPTYFYDFPSGASAQVTADSREEADAFAALCGTEARVREVTGAVLLYSAAAPTIHTSGFPCHTFTEIDVVGEDGERLTTPLREPRPARHEHPDDPPGAPRRDPSRHLKRVA